jgi:hypothetical protein
VGSVQITAMISDAMVAPRELSRRLTRLAFVESSTRASDPAACGVSIAAFGVVDVIGSPSACA